MEQRSKPPIMMGRVERRIRRRPIRSMRVSAMRVQRKLVMAMEREVNVGEENPMKEKIVAEKYMREFWRLPGQHARHVSEGWDKRTNPQSCWSPCSRQAIINALRFPPVRKSSANVIRRG
jgi:hypothetical protein